jgi:hypothetical protein
MCARMKAESAFQSIIRLWPRRRSPLFGPELSTADPVIDGPTRELQLSGTLHWRQKRRPILNVREFHARLPVHCLGSIEPAEAPSNRDASKAGLTGNHGIHPSSRFLNCQIP